MAIIQIGKVVKFKILHLKLTRVLIPPPRILARVDGWSCWFSGFYFARVKEAGQRSSGFTVLCLFCKECVFGSE